MSERFAQSAKAKLGTMSTSKVMIEAQRSALVLGHTFSKYDGQPFPELLDLEDETKELAQAIRENEGKKAISNEVGDVIFSLLNICRAYEIDFDEALENFAKRWLTRKSIQEDFIFEAGFNWGNVPLEVSEEIWQKVKKQLKQQEYQE
jgi:tetrapyrrole methylase family protein/MazG family protein